jgi:hypothetical protein
MDTIKRFTVLLALLDAMKEQGSWCGETHVQKCVYFLQTMLGVPTGYDYVLYKHGPFSSDLREDLALMRAHSLLGVQAQPYPYGPSLMLGETAHVLKERFSKTWEEYERQHRFVAEKIGRRGVADLERLATALFVTLEIQGGADVERRANYITQLKPHISLEQARRALEEVDKLIAESRELAVLSHE